MNHDLFTLFPNASPDFLARNTRQTPKLERNPGSRTLGTRKAKKQNPKRFLVRVTSIRKRLIDEDNLCEKYHVDCCRYAGLIPDDAANTTRIETTQRKTHKGEAEKITIEIFEEIENSNGD